MSNIHFELFKFMNEHGDKTQDVRKSVMPDREKVIKELEECLSASCRGYRPRLTCPYNDDEWDIMRDALALLKEQDEEHRRLLSWLGKFCRHIDNGDAWLTDEENIAFFKEKMKQQFGWDID